VRRSTFTNNGGIHGGALALASASLELSDSEFSGNHADEGAVIYGDVESVVVLTNATLTRNTAGAGGALHLAGPTSIRNCILWADTPAELLFTGSPDQLSISTSNLTGAYPTLEAFDPGFVDGQSNFRLRKQSRCIDTGDDDVASPRDIADQERRDIAGLPLCPAETPNCGSIADMGAHEYAP